MILVDEYAALPALVGRPAAPLVGQPLALTYSRAYRLTRALLDPGPARLATHGQFSRLVEALSAADQQVLHERLAHPNPKLLTIVDPRPLLRTAGAIQNTYTLSLLQAETLAAAVTHDWPIRFADARSASETVRRATFELGVDLATMT